MPDAILQIEGMSGEGGQTSGARGVQPREDDITESDDRIESWFQNLSEKLPIEDERTAPSPGSKPRIQPAPSMLYQDNEKFKKHFNPRLFYLGPITLHDWGTGKSYFKKEELAALFVKDYGLQHAVYNDIFRDIQTFLECYDGQFKRSNLQKIKHKEYWSWNLLVDGCALLFYMVCYVRDDLHKLKMADDDIALASNEIFMLKNQLPYGLLDLIMKRSKLRKEMPSLIHDFVKLHCIVEVNIEKGKNITTNNEPDHLLGLMYAIIKGTDPVPRSTIFQKIVMASRSDMHSDHHQEEMKGPIHWSPSQRINELKKVWIDLEPGVVLKGISFSPGIVSGKLKLPRLIMDNSTEVKLLNLIAYEMCPDFQNDLELTSYICFLNSLVANVEDVAELRSAGIIINYIFSDWQVLQLFRDITSKLVPNPTIYRLIQQEIQNHFERKGRKTIATWLAEAALVYFKTPWSTIAVLAAAFGIILTMVQAYFAIFPRR